MCIIIGELCQELLDQKRQKLNPKSFDRFETTIKYQVLPVLRDHKPDAVSTEMLQGIIDQQAQSHSLSTVKKTYSAVKQIFDLAEAQGYVTYLSNPFYGVVLPSAEIAKGENAVQPFNLDETNRFVREATRKTQDGQPVHNLGLLFVLGLYTGLKRGVLLSLTREDINLVHGIMYIRNSLVDCKDRTKGAVNSYTYILQPIKRPYILQLDDEAINVAGELLGSVDPREEKFIAKNGKLPHTRDINNAFHAILDCCGISRRGMSALEKTYYSKHEYGEGMIL